MKAIKLPVVLLIICLLCSLVAACTGETGQRFPAAPEVPTAPEVPAAPAPLTPMPLTEGFSLYENAAYRFKIQHPSEWILNDDFNDDTVVTFNYFSFDDVLEFHHANIVVFNSPGISYGAIRHMPLDEFSQAIEERLASEYDGFENIDSAEVIRYGRYDFVCALYKVIVDDDEYIFYIAKTATFNTVYRLEFNSMYENYEDSLEIFKSMLSSFEFIN